MTGLLGRWRATGADLPFGDPRAGHPEVALESYCWRIVDAARRRTLLVAATRCRDGAGRPWTSVVLSVLGPRGGRTVLEHSGDGGDLDPGGLGVRLDDRLAADPDGIRIDLGPRGALDVAFADRRDWPRRSLGGLGLGSVVPGLSQYWHPHLLGARVTGTLRLGRDEHRLDGATAYGEKNWGRGGTPPAWWWGQAAFDQDAMLAFAGGVLRAGPAGVPATALVVRAGRELAAFSPPWLVSLERETDVWRLRARSPTWSATVESAASGEPFHLPVPVPGTRELRALSHQYQDGRLAVRLRRGRRTVLHAETDLAALERGGLEAQPRVRMS